MARVYGRAKLCAVPRSAPFTFHAPYALARKVRNPIFFFRRWRWAFFTKKKKNGILEAPEIRPTFLSNKKQKKKTVLCDKRQKLTQASKANKLIYKDRK